MSKIYKEKEFNLDFSIFLPIFIDYLNYFTDNKRKMEFIQHTLVIFGCLYRGGEFDKKYDEIEQTVDEVLKKLEDKNQ